MDRVFDSCKPLIGVVHLPPLPGSPGYQRRLFPRVGGRRWGLREIIDYAVEEARKYEEAGFDGVIVENYGDQPYQVSVGAGQAAAMARVVSRVVESVGIPVGVNLLRNSGYEAVYVAYVSGARFVRVNNLCEVRVSTEGMLMPALGGVARAVSELGLYDDLEEGSFAILADVDVKHSYPITHGVRASRIVGECLARAGFRIAAIVATGGETGEEPSIEHVEELASAATASGSRLIVGSGVSPHNLSKYWRLADGFIVGTHVKVGDFVENPVSLEKARLLATLVRHYRRKEC